MIIKRNNFIVLMVWTGMIIAEYFLLSFLDIHFDPLVVTSWFFIINLILQMVLWKLTGQSLLSPFMLFMYCAYLFHCGQVIMTGLFPTVHFDYMNYITVYMTDISTRTRTLEVTIHCFNTIFLGGLIGSGIIGRGTIANNYPQDLSDNDAAYGLAMMKKVAVVLLVFSTPFRLYIDIRSFIAAIMGGYYGAIAVSYSGVIDCFAGFWYSAVILYYLSAEESKKRRFAVFVVIYLCIVMLSGNRGHQIVCLLTLFIVAFLSREHHITVKNVILACIGIYFLLVFIDVIYTMRESGIDYFVHNLGTVFSESFRTNILFETIGSFGETEYTPYLVLEGFRNKSISPAFGECFYKSLVSILPSIGSTLQRINNEANFTKMLGTSHTIGGSIVGEMYYNFRFLYWLFSIIIGHLLAWVSARVETGIKNKDYLGLAYSIPVFTNLLWWTRDSVSNSVRNIVWICIFIWLIKRIRIDRGVEPNGRGMYS